MLPAHNFQWSEADVAIVGLAGRFPGADAPARLWANVAAGSEGIVRLEPDELKAAGVAAEAVTDAAYVPAAAVLGGVDRFDAAFFGFSPRDAAILDPQHRHFLECAWEALEDAGYPPESFRGSIGVYAGCGMNSYFMFNLLTNPELVRSVGLFLLRHTGNDKDFLTTRVSYLLGLTGPSLGIQTACSTSLVAVHVACQQLLSRECDMALAGGVTIEIPHGVGYRYEEGEILSPDGHCRAFDAAARGTVFGSGVGIAVLRRLDDALAAGDHIYAVIKGSAVNNDGNSKIGYLAPSVDGQAAAVSEALGVSGVSADQIEYVEAHGTGTPVGDPIEIAALTQAFRGSTQRRGYCAIGSLKTNIGHLDTAAGIAGLIKTVKALEHKQLPPSLHFKSANPAIDFASTPFFVNTELRPWPAPASGPRYAAVNSLGVGGTNAHVILAEAPVAAASAHRRPQQVLVLSARTPAALESARQRLAAHLEAHPDLDLADVAFTLQVGRRAFAHRWTATAADAGEAVLKLRAVHQLNAPAAPTAPSLVYMFPGGGAQYPGMGRELFETEPVYRDAMKRCLGLIQASGGPDLEPLMFPSDQTTSAARAALERPLASVLSVFTTEYALAALYESWGLRPAAFLGHSLGEYVAAHLAGVMSLADALAITKRRGEIFERLPVGAMVSVALPEDELQQRLPVGAAVAAANAPEEAVASGSIDAIVQLERRLTTEGIDFQRVRIGVAAHSPVLDASLDEFHAFVSTLSLRPPVAPVMSCVTGAWAGPEMATADYWTRHLRGTVRFADAVRSIAAGAPACLFELGPGRALSSFARQMESRLPSLASMRHHSEAGSDVGAALSGVGALWAAGVDIDWAALHRDVSRRRVSLPTYPFESTRHWIEPGIKPPVAAPELLPRASELDEWFWRPTWRMIAPASHASGTVSAVLWLAHQDGRSQPFIDELRRRGHEVREVLVPVEIDPCDPAEVGRLFSGLESGPVPAVIVFDAFDPASPFEPMLHVAQAAGRADWDVPVAVVAITRGLAAIDAGSDGDPLQAVLLGPLSVLPREYPTLRAGSIDLPQGPPTAAVVAAVANELLSPAPRRDVALRAHGRWVRDYEPAVHDSGPQIGTGVTLVTGAFGGLGRLVSRWLAEHRGGPLLLLSRRRPADADALLEELRDLGATAEIVTADLANGHELSAALATATARYGRIEAVLHLAGRLDDTPLALKSSTSVAAVLAPKVAGTLNLAACLDATPPEALVLFSSTSAFLGLPGQADYAAANAFLAAFATSPRGRALGTRTVCWGAWRDRGMTRREASISGGPLSGFLGTAVSSSGTESVFEAHHEGTQWWYAEHRTRDGVGVLPGTAFIEILHAAVRAAIPGDAEFELSAITLLRPIELERLESCRVTTRVLRDGPQWRLSVSSDRSDGAGVVQHAEAVATPGLERPVPVDLRAAEERCNRRGIDGSEAFAAQGAHIRFGPRWQALRAVRFGETEALAELAVREPIAGDLATMIVHPVLLDVALVAGVGLLPGREAGGLLVPFSVGRVRVFGAVHGERLHAHVRLLEGSNAELGRLDITVVDDSGMPVYVAENVALRRVPDGQLHGRAAVVSPSAVLVERGIDADEGLAALDRVLSGTGLDPVLVVSPFAPRDLLHAVGTWWPELTPLPRRDEPGGKAASDGDDLETRIGAIWRELLGVERVEADDDFFALGGHSLLGVRLFSRIEKRLGHQLDLSTLFTARTVRALASHIRAGTTSRWQALTPVQATGTRPAFYCVHGVGGEVLTFMELSRALGPDQPFYGFRALGHGGRERPLTSVSDQAAVYVRELLEADPDGPHFIGGYSHGARVVFEMACILEAQGRRPALVALIDSWASDQIPRGPAWPARFALNFPRWLWHDLRLSTRRENADRLRRGIAWLGRLATPWRSRAVEVGDHMDVRALPDSVRAVYEANFKAFRDYHPGHYPGAVTVFRATAQPILSPHLPDHGWGQFAPQLRVVHVPGNHISIIAPPHVDELAAALLSEMDRAMVARTALR
jgi:acyl transferase domain-containing protein/thioesterase domain-containing protein